MGSPVQVEACSSAFRSIRLDLPVLVGKLLGEAPLRVPVGVFGLHRMASTPPKKVATGRRGDPGGQAMVSRRRPLPTSIRAVAL